LEERKSGVMPGLMAAGQDSLHLASLFSFFSFFSYKRLKEREIGKKMPNERNLSRPLIIKRRKERKSLSQQ
jgi:hypothetical protein